MNKLLKLLQQNKILISDGAWGTMLQSGGLKPGDCAEEWNVSHPEVIRSIADSYIQAGADIILTNSFGGSPLKLAGYGFAERAEELNFAAASVSRKAADDRVLVFASVGPTGQFLEPIGNITELEMIENFKIQIKALAKGGADAILIETMSDLSEAVCAVKATREVCDLPVAVSMTFERGARGYRTMMGVSIPDAVEQFSLINVDVIGTNCGNGIEQVVEIVTELRQNTDKYLIAQPNAGLPKLVEGETVFDQSAETMAEFIPDLIRAGANIIGGCCGTGPDHIKAMAKIVAEYQTGAF